MIMMISIKMPVLFIIITNANAKDNLNETYNASVTKIHEIY